MPAFVSGFARIAATAGVIALALLGLRALVVGTRFVPDDQIRSIEELQAEDLFVTSLALPGEPDPSREFSRVGGCDGGWAGPPPPGEGCGPATKTPPASFGQILAAPLTGVGAAGVENILNAARAQVQDARADIEVEPLMEVGETYEARLVIQAGEALELNTLLAETSEPVATSRPVQVTTRAIATATFSGERLPSLEPEEWQTVTPAAPAVWTWQILPKKRGQRQLIVTLNHAVLVGGKEVVLPVRHFPQIINVNIGWGAAIAGSVGRAWRTVTANLENTVAFAGLIGSACAAHEWYRSRRRRRKLVFAPDVTPADLSMAAPANSPAPAGGHDTPG